MRNTTTLILFVIVVLLLSLGVCSYGQTRIAAIGSSETLYICEGSTVTSINLMSALGVNYFPMADAVAFDSNGDLLIATEAGIFKTTPGSGLFTNTGLLNPIPDGSPLGTLLGLKDLAVYDPVPEPSSILALLAGIVGLGAMTLRRK